MASVEIRKVDKFFGSTQILHGVEIDIPDGEFVVLVGPSGCGKSTLLRMVAGLEEITKGEIAIGGRVVNQRAPQGPRHRHGVPELRPLPAHDRASRTWRSRSSWRRRRKNASTSGSAGRPPILGLAQFLLDRYPRQLSGGQRQRVAMGRAIVRDPQVFLFDEPLSNLDAKLRVQMRTEIKELHQRLKTTAIYVTHDQIEAMTMADRIVVMQLGEVEQMGAPLELYDRPTNLFVAGFIGSPAMNFIDAKVRAPTASRWPSPATAPSCRCPRRRRREAAEIVYGIRPEHLHLRERPRPACRGGRGRADRGRDPGRDPPRRHGVQAMFRERHRLEPGRAHGLEPQLDQVHVFDRGSGRR